MWSYDAALSSMAVQGVISGYVYRVVHDPTYAPIAGARVYFPEMNVPGLEATSQSDGRFAFWDSTYGGGTRMIRAEANGEAEEAVVYKTTTPPWSNLAISYPNVGYVNIIFPADTTTIKPAPVMELRVLVSNGEEAGHGDDAGGIILANTPLVFGVRTSEAAVDIDVPRVEVTGPQPESPGVRYATTSDKVDYLTEEYVPVIAGSYTVRATALPVFGGAPVTVSKTFLVINDSGLLNRENIPGAAPEVITDLSYPQDGATSLTVTIYPQITFTEPVVNVINGVWLMEEASGADVPVVITAVSMNGEVFEDLSEMPAMTPVTSITIRPLYGLKYGAGYVLTLNEMITDIDVDAGGQPARNSLTPYEVRFTTYSPGQVGELNDGYRGMGIVTLGRRAYIPDQGPGFSWLHVLDISDPSRPVEVNRENIPGRASDISGMLESPLTGGQILAVSAHYYIAAVPEWPSLVYFLGAEGDEVTPIGATILTSDMREGIVTRVRMHRDKAYAAVSTKGIYVIDIGSAVDEWRGIESQYGRNEALMRLIRPQGGAYRSSIINTLPMSNVMISGLAVDDYMYGGMSQALVLATGNGTTPLIVANPLYTGSSAILYAEPEVETEYG